ncbi:phosphoglycerate kinase [Candidatus Hydrogenisulfobacillus filiaventi]|uniref:Phosphoglycerate kinase n=1 Tax=Candidatus Hydrogenisulfobacillus filiaventi TaxID=2707344 RepID=A0A6F8ZJF6_9FIRM|nr:phosphoglycerate kinase [Candidatus Hydrogenisulfobacillus filiaventi]
MRATEAGTVAGSASRTTPVLRTLDDLDRRGLHNRRVLLRVDFNVPLDGAGQVADTSRIEASLPTVRWLLDRGARLVIMSHLGRPKGREERFSLSPVARKLGELLGQPVAFVRDVAGPEAQSAARALVPGHVLMVENLRFEPGETKNDPVFAERLSELGEYYVNDAFGTVHRAHASIVGVPSFIPGAAGFLLERELRALTALRDHPERPYWAIIGGAKVKDKVGLLVRLAEVADGLVIGGGMANTFLAAQGHNLGASRVEAEALDTARDILDRAEKAGIPVVLPQDVVAATAFAADAPHRVAALDDLRPDEMALDVGPATVSAITRALAGARTVFWNGPLGVFEFDAFAQGTMAVARMLADLDATVVVGGGDSLAAVHKAGVVDRISHASTGGGASLEFLEGKVLPGVQALMVPASE